MEGRVNEEDIKRLRQKFYKENGKTEEQETEDMVYMASYVILIVFVTCLAVAISLVMRYW